MSALANLQPASFPKTPAKRKIVVNFEMSKVFSIFLLVRLLPMNEREIMLLSIYTVFSLLKFFFEYFHDLIRRHLAELIKRIKLYLANDDKRVRIMS